MRFASAALLSGFVRIRILLSTVDPDVAGIDGGDKSPLIIFIILKIVPFCMTLMYLLKSSGWKRRPCSRTKAHGSLAFTAMKGDTKATVPRRPSRGI